MPIPSNDYDVGQAFKRIEEELIASMMKNMKRHTDWETDEGFQWEMWQALQLQALEKYRKENPEKFKGEFEEINKMIPEAIKSAREHGQMDQEIEILEAIRKGWKPPALDEGLSGAFFRLNDRKLNALIEATTGDFEKAEAAILRKANDDYRKIIFNAQMYANTGAATYEKAVDMATKDFLAAGINCIEYKNGSRHTLEDYCDMALRTAQKRAYLAGEGEKRQEWGIHTVIMNKRGQGQPCPLCLPFVGKIMIDDVYGGGSRKDGPYKLLSEAMAAGLYHPRCRDSHTAYFPDIDEEKKLTREEVKKTKEEYMDEEEANYCARQEEKYGRLAAFSLDPENQRKYEVRRKAWGEKAEQLQMKIGPKEEGAQEAVQSRFTPASTLEAAQSFAQRFIEKQFMDKTFKGEANFKGISVDNANAICEALVEVYERFPEMEKLSGIKVVSPKTKQGQKAFKDGADAVFSYDPIQHGIYVNKDVLKNAGTVEEYMKRSQDAWELVMGNLDKLSGPQRKLAEKYAEAGRSLVSGDNIRGLFIHELGHHVQWTMLDPKTTNAITARMSQYAPKVSGYAQQSNSEYLAECFAAYMNGEHTLLDSEYVKYLNEKRKLSIRKVVDAPETKQKKGQETAIGEVKKRIDQARQDAVTRLEGKEGEYASRLRMTIRNTDAKPKVVEGKSFWYDKEQDEFFFNPESQKLNDYNLVEVTGHESAHRLDELIYHSADNQKLTASIDDSKAIIMSHLDEIKEWFKDGGLYEDNMSVADILCAITDGELFDMGFLPYGHRRDYWRIPGRKQKEFFANMSNLHLVEDIDVEPLNSLIPELFEAWRAFVI